MKPDKEIAELYHKQSDLQTNWPVMPISGLREELIVCNKPELFATSTSLKT